MLIHSSFQAWGMLSRQTEEVGLGELGNPVSGPGDDLGLLGYRVAEIERADSRTVRISFEGAQVSSVTLMAPAGPRPLRRFPFTDELEFHPTPRFMGLFTCFLQAHALGWDISLIPPILPSTASTSTSTLVRVFGEVLGYEKEVLHMYKELGGRELVMRRKIEDGGATVWEPRYVLHDGHSFS
jgi:hypothetical protein